MNQQNNMEEYWQHLRSMGLSEEMIALYQQQMEQTMNLSSNWTNQLNQFSENIKQINQLFSGDDAGEAADAPSDIRLNPDTKLTAEEQWAIACGADVAFANGQYLNDLATGLGKSSCRELLSEWWDIDSTEELQEMIAWLKESGHRLEYDTICQALNTVSVKESKAFLREYAAANKLEEAVVLDRMRNTRDALELFRGKGLIAQDAQPEMLIWDFGRIINLSRAGFDAGYLSHGEALEHIMHCAPTIKRIYASWKDLSLSYQFARCVWNGVDADDFELFQENMKQLLWKEHSPWVVLPWS